MTTTDNNIKYDPHKIESCGGLTPQTPLGNEIDRLRAELAAAREYKARLRAELAAAIFAAIDAMIKDTAK